MIGTNFLSAQPTYGSLGYNIANGNQWDVGNSYGPRVTDYTAHGSGLASLNPVTSFP